VIPTTSLVPESAQRLKKKSWLSLQGWVPSFVDEEEIVATMVAAMSSCWRQQECAVDNLKRAGGGRRRRRTQGQGGGNVYARWAGGGQHDKRGEAEGAGRGEWEADNMMRGGRGWTTRGKQVVDDTTRGLSLQWQKMVESTHVGVRRHQHHCMSVADAPGEGGVGTHRHQSQRAIYNNNKDAMSKNDGNHDVVFLTTVAVGA
jgi:hypothetical protein